MMPSFVPNARVLQQPARYIDRLIEEGGRNVAAKDRQLRQHILPFFGGNPIGQIESFDVERYKKARQSTGAAKATINRELAVLSHLLNKAVEWKWIKSKTAKISRFKEVPFARYSRSTEGKGAAGGTIRAADICRLYLPRISGSLILRSSARSQKPPADRSGKTGTTGDTKWGQALRKRRCQSPFAWATNCSFGRPGSRSISSAPQPMLVSTGISPQTDLSQVC